MVRSHPYLLIVWVLQLALAACPVKLTAVQEAAKPSLIAAIRKGSAAEVRRLLEGGASPNVRETLISKPSLEEKQEGGTPYPGDTALMVAIQESSLAMVRTLLDRGADPNLAGQAGFTPLFVAVNRGKPEIAKLLLDRKAKVDRQNGHGDTALVFAANNGSVSLVKLLLDRGASIDGVSGWSPLGHAAYNGMEEVVRLLIRRGANVNLRRPPYMTPLESANAQGNAGIAALIRKAGGKGRSSAAMEKERKAAVALWRKQQQQAVEPTAEQMQITEDDQRVIEAALLDLLTYKGKDLYVHAAKGAAIVVLIDRTARGPGMILDGQLNGELDDRQANDVSLEIRESLRRRNAAQVSLGSFKPTKTAIRLRNEQSARPYPFEREDPEVRAWAQIFLPGYSKGRDRAVLRFWLGPSEHGATGTYFFIKDAGAWRIQWRKFSFYV